MNSSDNRFGFATNLRALHKKRSKFWTRAGEKKSLALFHAAAKRVPAYHDFLKKHKVNSAKIKTFQDFQSVPPVTKDNYLRSYSLEKLVWDGELKQRMVFAVTSGSTGKPTYFPRSELLDDQSSLLHELFFLNNRKNLGKSTLVIIGFGMGAWVGGLITFRAFQKMAERGYPLAFLTPGPSKKEIFEGLRNIAGKFDQVILCGYPPFLKDIIDEGSAEGIDWSKLNLKIVFAAEGFSEGFRDYIAKKTRIKNTYTDIMNIYGTADLGTMAEETPLAVLIRRLAVRNAEFYANIFEDAHRLPTLAQFHPEFVNFESVKGEIFCTGDNVLPLVRYQLGDYGGVRTFLEMESILAKQGISLKHEAQELGFTHTLTELPFVYVYERSDLSTKLYGAIIYPEHVRAGIAHPSLDDYFTGKFTMLTEVDKRHNEYLEIHVELKPKVRVSPALKEKVRALIGKSLIEKNSEHRNNTVLMPGRMDPRVVFWDHEHPKYFKAGGKQKWVQKRK